MDGAADCLISGTSDAAVVRASDETMVSNRRKRCKPNVAVVVENEGVRRRANERVEKDPEAP